MAFQPGDRRLPNEDVLVDAPEGDGWVNGAAPASPVENAAAPAAGEEAGQKALQLAAAASAAPGPLGATSEAGGVDRPAVDDPSG